MQKIGYILFNFIIVFWKIRLNGAGIYEKKLLAHLFDKTRWDAHNPMERPVSEDNKPMQVYLKCFLNQVMDMDEKNQVLSTIMWLDLKWTDYHFRWNANEFANIKQINLPPERMWKPDIILYNSASEKFDQIFPTKVIVQNDGKIKWVPPGLFHSNCEIDVNWFPFDSQNCIIKFGTWTYQGNTVDLKLQCDNETEEEQPCHLMNEVDLSAYLAHSEWALESALIKRNVQTYGHADQKYIDVTIYVHMQRKALYYMFNILVPCMIMSAMALLVFTLPPDANEKIVLGVTVLLALTMLLQLVADKLPQTSSGNPVLVLYFICTIILCSLSLVCAVVLLSCRHHTGGIVYVPWWVEVLINSWLASVLRIDRAPVGSNETVFDTNTDQLLISQPKVMKQKYRDILWPNIIDFDSEFRPSLLIVKKPQSSTDLKKNDKLSSEFNCLIRDDNPLLKKYKFGIEMQGNKAFTEASPMHVIVSNSQHHRSPWGPEFKLSISKDSQKDHEINSGYVKTNLLHESLLNTNTDQSTKIPVSEDIKMVENLRQVARELHYITRHMRREDRESRTSMEWRLAARVLDRFCLLIFGALNVFTAFGILTSAPTVIKAFTSTGAKSQPM